MVLLAAAASTSIVLTAFYRATQIPDSYKRNHVYNDDDGEATAPTECEGACDRTPRILIAFFALATFLLSAWNWTLHKRDAELSIITIAWVSCPSSYLLAFLIVLQLIITGDSVLLVIRSSQRPRRYIIGLLIAVSSLTLSLVLAIITLRESPNQVTSWAQVALGVSLAYTCCSL